MDGSRFDGLVKALTRGAANRRGALRALAGVALAGASLPSAAGAATCRRKGETCGGRRGRCCRDLECCGGRCRDVRRDERFCGDCATACSAGRGETCSAGTCLCPDGRPPCGDQCCPEDCSCTPAGLCSCPVRG